MEFRDNQRQELIKIIENEFEEEELKTICLNNTEKLHGNPYNQIQGNTVSSRLNYLVDYLIRKKLVDNFLELCLKDPANQKTELNKFYSQRLRLRLKKIFHKYNFQILINLLEKFKEDRYVISSYNNYLENNDSPKEKITLFDISQLIDDLLMLMCSNSYEENHISDNSHESCYLLDFVEKFLCEIVYIQNIKEDLQKWIRTNCPEVKFPNEIKSQDLNNMNIANYLFFVIEPKTGNNNKREFFIKAQFAQFANNKTQEKIREFPIEFNTKKAPETYAEKQIIDFVYQSIQAMTEKLKLEGIELSSLPIIELFVPISILGTEFDVKKITGDFDTKMPIGQLYPLIVRSYERFSKDKNDRLNIVWQEKWTSLQDFINNAHNTQEFINNVNSNKPCISNLTADPFPNSRNRRKLFERILSEGFPLCLWTRYTETNQIDNIHQYFQLILNIDSHPFPDFCKLYKILRNIHDIRKEYMKEKDDFGYKLGVLFDHYKIPTKSSQLISPNTAMKV